MAIASAMCIPTGLQQPSGDGPVGLGNPCFFVVKLCKGRLYPAKSWKRKLDHHFYRIWPLHLFWVLHGVAIKTIFTSFWESDTLHILRPSARSAKVAENTSTGAFAAIFPARRTSEPLIGLKLTSKCKRLQKNVTEIFHKPYLDVHGCVVLSAELDYRQ